MVKGGCSSSSCRYSRRPSDGRVQTVEAESLVERKFLWIASQLLQISLDMIKTLRLFFSFSILFSVLLLFLVHFLPRRPRVSLDSYVRLLGFVFDSFILERRQQRKSRRKLAGQRGARWRALENSVGQLNFSLNVFSTKSAQCNLSDVGHGSFKPIEMK